MTRKIQPIQSCCELFQIHFQFSESSLKGSYKYGAANRRLPGVAGVIYKTTKILIKKYFEFPR